MKNYKTKAESKGEKSSIKIIEDQGSNSAEKILDISESEKVDIVIVGTKGEKSSEQFLLVSTSYKVEHYSKFTVIIVK